MTTKSGTNALHGSLFETNRDYGYGVARTRDNFTNTAAKLIRNEYGGTVGGPFHSENLQRQESQLLVLQLRRVQTAQRRLWQLPRAHPGNARWRFLRTGGFAGTFQTVYDPLTTGARPTYTATPFNYGGKLNRIDPARISPLAKYIYSILPQPNVPGVNPLIGNNYSAPNPQIQNQYTWGARFRPSLYR
jgi:hypothetical protein